MIFIYVCLLASVIAAPAKHDQRQDGPSNFRADLDNFAFIIAYPKRLTTESFFRENKNGVNGNVQQPTTGDS